MTTKHPEIYVPLVGEDGNIFAIGGRVGRAMHRAGIPRSEIDEFYAALSASPSYYAALETVMSWVNTEWPEDVETGYSDERLDHRGLP